MKHKMITAVLASLGMTLTAFAQEQEKAKEYDVGYVKTYYNLGAAALPVDDKYVVTPGIGAGIRAIEGNYAVDVSGNFAANFRSEDYAFAYSAPKLLMLTYVNPEQSASLFYGFGGSWGGIHSITESFDGILANASVGYEFDRTKKLRSIVKLDGGIPVIPVFVGNQGMIFQPLFELSFNLAY